MFQIKIIIFLIVSAQANADVQPADNDKIISLMKQGVPLIDIRTNSEWQNTGIIKNSKLLTFFDKDGKSDGPHTSWHENGQKAAEGTSKDGEEVSGKYWNSKGEEVETREEAFE